MNVSTPLPDSVYVPDPLTEVGDDDGWYARYRARAENRHSVRKSAGAQVATFARPYYLLVDLTTHRYSSTVFPPHWHEASRQIKQTTQRYVENGMIRAYWGSDASEFYPEIDTFIPRLVRWFL